MKTLLPQLLSMKIPYKVWYGMRVEKKPFTGISRSHKMIVEFAKNTGMPYVIIAEDDILFTCKDAWKHYIENMPAEFDLYLGTVSGGRIDEKSKTVSDWSGMILYTISARFYDTFLAADENKNIDRYLSGVGLQETERRLGRPPVYKICYPIVATCTDGYSDNSAKEINHDQYFAAYAKYNSQ